jgi:hypothetical protein
MKTSTKITRDNIKLCEDAHDELVLLLEDLVKMTRKCPVECVFGDFRRVFANRQDIVDFIEELKSEISAFKRAA